MKITRTTDDGIDVIDGKDVFRCVDSEGLPLSLCLDSLRAKGMVMEWRSFVVAARNNYSLDKIMAIVREAAFSMGVSLSEGFVAGIRAMYAR